MTLEEDRSGISGQLDNLVSAQREGSVYDSRIYTFPMEKGLFLSIDQEQVIFRHIRAEATVTPQNSQEILAAILPEQKALQTEMTKILAESVSVREPMDCFFFRYQMHILKPLIWRSSDPLSYELSFEDLRQRVALKLTEQLQKYIKLPDPDYPFGVYAHRIALNEARDRGRRHVKQAQIFPLRLGHVQDTDTNTELGENTSFEAGNTLGPTTNDEALKETLFLREFWTDIKELVGETSHRYLYLFYVEHLKIEEIAQLENKTKSAIKMALMRARNELKDNRQFRDTWSFGLI